eukprot:6870216-Pyramimonas_sp.AAC.1
MRPRRASCRIGARTRGSVRPCQTASWPLSQLRHLKPSVSPALEMHLLPAKRSAMHCPFRAKS